MCQLPPYHAEPLTCNRHHLRVTVASIVTLPGAVVRLEGLEHQPPGHLIVPAGAELQARYLVECEETTKCGKRSKQESE